MAERITADLRGSVADVSDKMDALDAVVAGLERENERLRKALLTAGRARAHKGGGRMSATDGSARIDTFDGWDDYEGEYDYYCCHACGEYLTDSLRIALDGDAIPRTCPNCGMELRW